MKNNLHEKDLWKIKTEVYRLKKMLQMEVDPVKRKSLESDLIKYNNLVDILPYARVNCGITNQMVKEDTIKEEKELENFLEHLNQNFDFYYEMANKYKRLYIKNVSDVMFDKNLIEIDDITKLISHSFEERFTDFCNKELNSGKYFMTNNLNLNNSECFNMVNTRFQNHYVFKTSNNLTYYDVFGIIYALSKGYTYLYYKLKDNSIMFKDTLPMFNQLVISDSINNSKSFEDYTLFYYNRLSSIIVNSNISFEFLKYNWSKDFKIKDYRDFKYNYKNSKAIVNLFNSILSFELYRIYSNKSKDEAKYMINYILDNINSKSIFEVLKNVGITQYDLLDDYDVKKHIKNYQAKSVLIK